MKRSHRSNGMPLRGVQLHPEKSVSGERFLRVSVVAWLVVTLVRPQDMFPFLRVIAPGVLCNVAVFLGLMIRLREVGWRNPVATWYAVLMGAIVSGVFFATNTFWLFNMFLIMASYWMVLILALPIVMRTEMGRESIRAVFAAAFTATPIWAVLHRGHGQGAWLGDENDVALFLNIGVCLMYFLAKSEKSRAMRNWMIAAGILSFCASILSFSRGGFAGMVAAVLGIALFSGRILRVLVVVSLMAVLAYPILANLHPPEGRGKSRTYLEELSSISDSNDPTRLARIYTWSGGWVMFKDNPILGVGAGNYAYRLGGYESNPELQKINTFGRSFAGRAAHSTYFTLLPELGLAGSIPFFAIYFLIVRRCWAISRSPHVSSETALFRGVGAALLSFTVAGAFISALYYPPYWMLAGLVVAPTFGDPGPTGRLRSDT